MNWGDDFKARKVVGYRKADSMVGTCLLAGFLIVMAFFIITTALDLMAQAASK